MAAVGSCSPRGGGYWQDNARRGLARQGWPGFRRGSCDDVTTAEESCQRNQGSKLRPREGTARNRVVPLFLQYIGMAFEIDVGALCVERAKDTDAFVSDFISEATRAEPATGLGIGCRLHLLMRGGVNLRIGGYVAIGTDAQTVALRQGIARIRHARIKYRAARSAETEVIPAHAAKGRAAHPKKGTQTDSFNAV